MSIGSWFDRLGENVGNAPKESWFTLAQALSAAPGNRPLQGLAQGIAGFGQAAGAVKKRKMLADAFAQSDMTPVQRQLLQSAPELAMPALAKSAFEKPQGAEQPTAVREYEYARGQGFTGTFQDYEKMMKEAGRSSVTVNNLPAEVGARIGLGEGFLKEFDDIKSRAKKFYGAKSPYDQVKRRGQVFFNTGEGGKLWADVESGKEALVRQLTGAGMAQQEAENQVSRYAISPWDTEYDALQKLERLRRDLGNTAIGAYKGRGGTYTPPATDGDGGVIRYDASGNRIQ